MLERETAQRRSVEWESAPVYRAIRGGGHTLGSLCKLCNRAPMRGGGRAQEERNESVPRSQPPRGYGKTRSCDVWGSMRGEEEKRGGETETERKNGLLQHHLVNHHCTWSTLQNKLWYEWPKRIWNKMSYSCSWHNFTLAILWAIWVILRSMGYGRLCP